MKGVVMELLKKRSVAIIIAVLIVLLSTVYSVNRTLGAKADAVGDGFYSGAYYEGYVHKSIASQLEARVDTASALLAVAADYSGLSGECASLRAARDGLEGMLEGEGGVASLYDANAELETAFRALYSELLAAGPSDRDRDSAELYEFDFSGAQRVIANSGYNESVREFRRDVLGEFPAGFLARVSFVSAPELFE